MHLINVINEDQKSGLRRLRTLRLEVFVEVSSVVRCVLVNATTYPWVPPDICLRKWGTPYEHC